MQDRWAKASEIGLFSFFIVVPVEVGAREQQKS